MNVTRNPRLDPKRIMATELFTATANINLANIASLLNTLRELFPGLCSKAKLKSFLECHMETVEYIDGEEDSEMRDHIIEQLIKGAPYINWELAESLLKVLTENIDRRDRIALLSPAYREALLENVLIMLMTLHYDWGFGEKRIRRVTEQWAKSKVEDPENWLKAFADFETDHEADRIAIEEILSMKKRRSEFTLREQLDARQELAALKAYQSEVLMHG